MEQKNKEYQRKYYIEHREKILKTVKEKKLCEICNKYISKSNMAHHEGTRKHLLKVSIKTK